jgi:hypothetical protein
MKSYFNYIVPLGIWQYVCPFQLFNSSDPDGFMSSPKKLIISFQFELHQWCKGFQWDDDDEVRFVLDQHA